MGKLVIMPEGVPYSSRFPGDEVCDAVPTIHHGQLGLSHEPLCHEPVSHLFVDFPINVTSGRF